MIEVKRSNPNLTLCIASCKPQGVKTFQFFVFNALKLKSELKILSQTYMIDR